MKSQMGGGLRAVGITGVGSSVGRKVLTNFDLEKMVATSDDWIRTRTGIRERRIADDGIAASDLATDAAMKALAAAGVGAEQVELIICGTVTPDMPFPVTACLVEKNIGAAGAGAFDLNVGCTGFIYGLATGAQFVATGCYDTVLVVGVDVLSRVLDWNDRGTCVLFGDGAGAVVLQPVPDGRGILATLLGSDGNGGDHLKIAAGGSRQPSSPDTVAQGLHYVQMNGPEVFKFAVRAMPYACERVLEKSGIPREDVDLLIPHQANIRIIEAAVSRLGLPWEKVMVNIDRYGNMSSASIPVALDEALQQGRVGEGDTVLMVSFGAGLSWGACVMRL